MLLSQTAQGMAWLSQFKSKDQDLAATIVDNIEVVTLKAFEEGLTKLITSLCADTDENVAFYLEADVDGCEVIFDFEKRNDDNYVCRAVGEGPSPFEKSTSDALHLTHLEDENTEGEQSFDVNALLFNFLQKVQHTHKNLFINPGPDQIRMYKIRKIFILTDFIGSGEAVRYYLYKMWKIPTIRSWHSLKYITIEIVSYGITKTALTHLAGHRLRPKTHYVTMAKTLTNLSEDKTYVAQVQNIVARYNPSLYDFYKEQYGYQTEDYCYIDDEPGVRYYDDDYYSADFNRHQNAKHDKRYSISLMVFEYGFPSTMPYILSKTTKTWHALFPAISQEILGKQEVCLDLSLTPRQRAFAAQITTLLEDKNINFDQNSAPFRLIFETVFGDKVLMLMKLLKTTRTLKILANRSQLSAYEIEYILEQTNFLGWTQEHSNHLTNKGMTMLKLIIKAQQNKKTLSKTEKKYYYPSQLRALTST